MKKLFAAAIAVSALCCAPVLAADLPRKAPAYQAAPVAPAFSWSGFYVGGSLGYAWNDSSWVYHDPTGPWPTG